MAYNYTLQTKLQAPTAANKRKVNAEIQRSFSSISFNYNDRASKKAIKDIKNIGKAADDAGKKVKNFGDRIGAQGTSYLSYALVSGVIIRLTSAFAGATNEAIRFEKELIKIAQTTRKSNAEIIKNARIITDISREYGLATNKVGELTRLLAQTGLSFRQAADGAKTLARTELLASFDSLKDTTEGLIALMNSFNLSTVDAAKGLEAINAVSKRFAVESGDIVEAIKRTGGAFSAAGGDINELIALFTSVRATSRESGETIATAFRTIFGRLQRPKTIDYFKELNIELADAQGNFVGGYAAIERISRGLNELGIRAGSIKFAEVAEQVGGIRQLSKVIPLLTKFSDAQDALAVANAAEAESEDDVAKAKKSLSFQIAQLTADFRALIFEITQTAGFKLIATLFIETARAAIDLTRALKPLIPIFATIGAFKGFKVASAAFNKFQGVKNQAQGFNRGGPVPGSGNGDTVPAMLEPGEFVIRKSAVQAYGTQNLENINKYGLGGKVSLTGGQLRSTYKGLENVKDDEKYTANVIAKKINVRTHNRVLAGMIASKRKKPKNLPWQLFEDGIAYAFNTQLNSKSNAYLDYPRKPGDAKFLKEGVTYRDQDVENKAVFRKGNNNETMLAKLVGSGQYKEGKNVTVYYPDNPSQIAAVVKEKAEGKSLKFGKANIPKFAKGGPVGTDTVPALLTPGEFVINRKSAQAFGYGKLGEINKYAKGGHVSRQKFSQRNGSNPASGRVGGGTSSGSLVIPVKSDGTLDVKVVEDQSKEAKENTKALRELVKSQKIESKKRGTAYKDRLKRRYSPLDQQMLANKQGRNISSRRFDGVPSREEFISAKPSKLAGRDVIGGMSKSGQKQAKAQKELTKETTKLKKGFSLSGSSVLTFGFGLSAVGGILESFGLEMNSVSAAQKKNSILLLSTAAALISYSAQIKRLGANLRGGNIQDLAKKVGLGGPAKKLGGVVRKLGSSIAKNGAKLAKGLGVLAALDIGGSLLAAVQGDASKTRDAAIKSGNAEEAGAAAVKAFGQELNNSIPIIGGFLNFFGANTFAAWVSGLSGVIKASAELEATFVKNDKVFSESFKNLNKAVAVGDSSAINEQVAIIASAAKDEKLRGENVLGGARSANRGSTGRDLGVGAARGGVAGAATGATIGTFLGGPLGALIGGGLGVVLGAATGAITNLGSSSKVVAASATTASKAFERFADNMIKAVNSVSPAIDAFEAKMIIAGASAEEAAAAVDKKFGSSIKNLGLLRSSEDIAKANERLEETQKKLKEAQDRRTEAADDWFGNAEAIEGANVKALESEEKLTKERIAAAKASLAAKGAARALREEQLIINAAYRDAAKSLRLLTAELNDLDSKVANLDLARELASTPLGATSGTGVLRRRFGTDKLSGSLKDVSSKGQLGSLRQQAETFLGPEAGKQVKRGALLQKAADAVTKDITTNGKSLSKALDAANQNILTVEAEKKSGVIDTATANRQRRDITEDFLKDNVFGGSIPAELEGQIKGIVLEVSKAFEAGEVSAEQLSKIFENGGTKLSAQAVKAVQDQLGQQAKAAAELGTMKGKLADLELDQAQRLFDQAKRANESIGQLSEDRINALQSAGLDSGALRSARRSSIASRSSRNLKLADQPSGLLFPASDRGSSGVREGAEKQRNRLASADADLLSRDRLKQLDQEATDVEQDVTDRVAENKARKESIQNIKQINQVLNTDIGLRKESLALQIEEANARRNQIQALNDAVGDLILEFGFGTDKQRSDLFEQSALAKSAISQGGLQGLTGDQRGAVGSFLDRFAGAGQLDILGGKTAAQVKGNFAAQEAVRGGLIKPSEFKKFADAAAKKAVPVEDRIKEVINSTYDEIEKSQKAINAGEKAIVDSQRSDIELFSGAVAEFANAVAPLFEKKVTTTQDLEKIRGTNEVITPDEKQVAKKKELEANRQKELDKLNKQIAEDKKALEEKREKVRMMNAGNVIGQSLQNRYRKEIKEEQPQRAALVSSIADNEYKRRELIENEQLSRRRSLQRQPFSGGGSMGLAPQAPTQIQMGDVTVKPVEIDGNSLQKIEAIATDAVRNAVIGFLGASMTEIAQNTDPTTNSQELAQNISKNFNAANASV